MSRQISPLGIVILFVIGFGVGVLLIVISNNQRGESLQKAYERGKIDGLTLDTTVDTLPIAPNEAPWQWLDTTVSVRFDSTDTMPAVDTIFDYWIPMEGEEAVMETISDTGGAR